MIQLSKIKTDHKHYSFVEGLLEASFPAEERRNADLQRANTDGNPFGAHNFVRPLVESYPHHWTHQDDCKAILNLIGARRIQVSPIVSCVVSPEDATEIYNQLCDDPSFPMGTVFDWRNIK